MSRVRSRRIVATVVLAVSALTPLSASALARPSAHHGSAAAAGVGAANSPGAAGSLSPLDTSDECGPPGALPGIFRCESQKTEIDGDGPYNVHFIDQFRARFPSTPLDNNEIVNLGHAVCKVLETSTESAVVQAWLNYGYDWNGATWIVGTSENHYCPSLRGGDVNIPGAP